MRILSLDKPNKKRKLMDLTGDRFGRLVAVKEVERRGVKRYYLCKCDCGVEKEIYMASLRSGATKSCGCLKKQRATETHTHDLSNKKFGRLVAIKIVGKHGRKAVNMWSCDCDCGNSIEVRTDHLNSGEVRSCGCLKKEQDRKNLCESLERNSVDGVVVPLLKSKLYTNNKSGIKGVSWTTRERKWRAVITLKGKDYHLGYFEVKNEAIKARKEAEEIMHLPYVEALKELEKIRKDISD